MIDDGSLSPALCTGLIGGFCVLCSAFAHGHFFHFSPCRFAVLSVQRLMFCLRDFVPCPHPHPKSTEKRAKVFFSSGTKVGKKQPVTRPVNTPPRGKKKRPKSLAISLLEANLSPIFKDAAGAFYHPCVF
jgi:hypothetical protein